MSETTDRAAWWQDNCRGVPLGVIYALDECVTEIKKLEEVLAAAGITIERIEGGGIKWSRSADADSGDGS